MNDAEKIADSILNTISQRGLRGAMVEALQKQIDRAEILKTKNEITHKRMMDLIDREEDYLEEISRLKAENKEIAEMLEIENKSVLSLTERIVELSNETQSLKDELQDWKDTQKNVMEEDCGDEKHCTCVPVLRKEIESLKKENESDCRSYEEKIQLYVGKYKSLKAHADKLAEALEKIANDKENTHDVNGKFIRKVWYVEEAKRALKTHAEFKDRKEKE